MNSEKSVREADTRAKRMKQLVTEAGRRKTVTERKEGKTVTEVAAGRMFHT